MPNPPCRIEGCHRPARAPVSSHGLCNTHYRRQYRHGSPHVVKPRGWFREVDREALFWAKVSKTPACWKWRGCRDEDGYGRFSAGDYGARAHRFSYELANGPIPAGLEVDHLCGNPSCVNPAHLELVTHAENLRRSSPNRNARKTHCMRGHAFDEANTITNRKTGKRSCRECMRQSWREYARAKRRR